MNNIGQKLPSCGSRLQPLETRSTVILFRHPGLIDLIIFACIWLVIYPEKIGHL